MKISKHIPSIVAIIVTYNGMKWLEKCIDSVCKSSVPVKLIVIDNASSDGTPQWIKNHYSQVELVEAGVNLGFGKANNLGFKRAIELNANYIFLLNQDAYIQEYTIFNLIEVISSNNEIGILSPVHLNYNSNSYEAYFEKYILPTAKEVLNHKFYQVPFIHAACWLISASLLKKVGGFDPLFFQYGEDNDYIQRATFYGYKVGFTINASFFHFGTHSIIGNKSLFEYNRILLLLKNPTATIIGAFGLVIKSWMSSIGNEKNEIYSGVLKNWFKIIQSRKEQLKEYPFLN